jgi:ElaB/YqjD/DUF883 family membrane-anchored ribosome-binding protein
MDTTDAMNKLEEAAPETMNRLQETAKHKLADVSNKVADVSHKVAERSRVAATTTDAYVREYAWSSVALAALMGMIIGLMMRRS